MKLIVIRWNDGSETRMVVHKDTDVLAAYEPVLKHIASITETNLDSLESKVIWSV